MSAWVPPASGRGGGEVDFPLCALDCGHMSAFAQDRSRVAESNARQSDRVKLDVGGCFFHVSRKVLTAQCDSMLDSLFSGRFQIDTQADGSVFIDRQLPQHCLMFVWTLSVCLMLAPPLFQCFSQGPSVFPCDIGIPA